MGFFEKAAKAVAKGAVDYAKSTAKEMERKRERVNHYKDMYEKYSDSELRDKLDSTSGERKMAIIELLQERGY